LNAGLVDFHPHLRICLIIGAHPALILRRTVRSVSKDRGASSDLWILLRDAAARLLRMRVQVMSEAFRMRANEEPWFEGV
jgi:hypothetical protein